jgi:tetratricopeptide (TPR) repeat protein
MLLHLYLQLDMPEQALSYAKALTRDNCIAPKWWKALAHVNLSLGRYEEALAALTIRGYLAPLSAEERKLWADLNLQMNIPIKAAEIYEEMIREKPDKRLLKNLVTAWQRLDRPEKGLEILDRIQPEVNDPEFLMLKGDLLYALKRFDAANRVYQRAAQFDFPQSGRAWLLAGYAAWQINDLGASCRAFENAAKHRRQRKAALLAMDRIRETQEAVR